VLLGFVLVAVPFAIGSALGERAAEAQSVKTASPLPREKASVDSKADGAAELAKHPLFVAKRQHLLNVAKLDRIESIARAMDDNDLLARVAVLRPLEERRFRRSMARGVARHRYNGS